MQRCGSSRYELCPPAPADGYFWRQVRAEFLAWAGVDAARCRPFAVDAADLEAMCAAYETAIAEAGGLDVVMLGLGPNAHLASNEPGCAFDLRTRPVRLLDETVRYILTDDVIQGPVCERAVTLGLGTIMAAREVVLLVSGEAKADPLARARRRQRGANGRPLALDAVERQLRAVREHEVVDDGGPEPGAAELARARLVDAIEALRDARQIGAGDADTRVAHAHLHTFEAG